MNSTFASSSSLKISAVVASLFATGLVGCAGSAANEAARVAAPVVLSCERPMVVRAEAGSIWAGYRVSSEPRRAWPYPSRGPVEDLRLEESAGDKGYLIMFRQGGLSWLGKLDADRRIQGELQTVNVPAEEPAASLSVAKR